MDPPSSALLLYPAPLCQIWSIPRSKKKDSHLPQSNKVVLDTFGISTPFGVLSPTKRKVIHVLLTRSPLPAPFCKIWSITRSKKEGFSPPQPNKMVLGVRLACLRRAASVSSEPGSNSPCWISLAGNYYEAWVTRTECPFPLHLSLS